MMLKHEIISTGGPIDKTTVNYTPHEPHYFMCQNINIVDFIILQKKLLCFTLCCNLIDSISIMRLIHEGRMVGMVGEPKFPSKVFLYYYILHLH